MIIENNWEDWFREKAEWESNGLIKQNPTEALKRGYITQEEYMDLVQDQEMRWR